MKTRFAKPALTLFGLMIVITALGATSHIGAQDDPVDHTALPMPEPPIRVFDARNATPPPRFEVKAPSHAPNVLIILLDNIGFEQPRLMKGEKEGRSFRASVSLRYLAIWAALRG
jgi:hypothetical protein